MPLGDYPPAVVATALALPPLLLLAAVHLSCTASFGPCTSLASPTQAAGGGDPRVSAAFTVMLLLAFLSAGGAVLEEMAEADSDDTDFLHCYRDIFLIATGHACYPLAALVAQTTVWRRKTVVSRCMRAASSAVPRCLFLTIVFVAFVASALACVAWPVPQPWAIRPAPPLRTALLTAPGVGVFTLALLLAGCNGITPLAEAMAVLAGAVCALGALATTLVPWVPPAEPGISLPAVFDERALANTLLLCAALLLWFAAVQWARRPPAAPGDDYGTLEERPPTASAVSAALLLSGPTPGPTRGAVGQAQHSALGKYLRRKEMGEAATSEGTLGESLLGGNGSGTSAAGSRPDAPEGDTQEEPHSDAALRQERAITALWFAKGLLDSVPGVRKTPRLWRHSFLTSLRYGQ